MTGLVLDKLNEVFEAIGWIELNPKSAMRDVILGEANMAAW